MISSALRRGAVVAALRLRQQPLPPRCAAVASSLLHDFATSPRCGAGVSDAQPSPLTAVASELAATATSHASTTSSITAEAYVAGVLLPFLDCTTWVPVPAAATAETAPAEPSPAAAPRSRTRSRRPPSPPGAGGAALPLQPAALPRGRTAPLTQRELVETVAAVWGVDPRASYDTASGMPAAEHAAALHAMDASLVLPVNLRLRVLLAVCDLLFRPGHAPRGSVRAGWIDGTQHSAPPEASTAALLLRCMAVAVDGAETSVAAELRKALSPLSYTAVGLRASIQRTCTSWLQPAPSGDLADASTAAPPSVRLASGRAMVDWVVDVTASLHRLCLWGATGKHAEALEALLVRGMERQLGDLAAAGDRAPATDADVRRFAAALAALAAQGARCASFVSATGSGRSFAAGAAALPTSGGPGRDQSLVLCDYVDRVMLPAAAAPGDIAVLAAAMAALGTSAAIAAAIPGPAVTAWRHIQSRAASCMLDGAGFCDDAAILAMASALATAARVAGIQAPAPLPPGAAACPPPPQSTLDVYLGALVPAPTQTTRPTAPFSSSAYFTAQVVDECARLARGAAVVELQPGRAGGHNGTPHSAAALSPFDAIARVAPDTLLLWAPPPAAVTRACGRLVRNSALVRGDPAGRLAASFVSQYVSDPSDHAAPVQPLWHWQAAVAIQCALALGGKFGVPQQLHSLRMVADGVQRAAGRLPHAIVPGGSIDASEAHNLLAAAAFHLACTILTMSTVKRESHHGSPLPDADCLAAAGDALHALATLLESPLVLQHPHSLVAETFSRTEREEASVVATTPLPIPAWQALAVTATAALRLAGLLDYPLQLSALANATQAHRPEQQSANAATARRAASSTTMTLPWDDAHATLAALASVTSLPGLALAADSGGKTAVVFVTVAQAARKLLTAAAAHILVAPDAVGAMAQVAPVAALQLLVAMQALHCHWYVLSGEQPRAMHRSAVLMADDDVLTAKHPDALLLAQAISVLQPALERALAGANTSTSSRRGGSGSDDDDGRMPADGPPQSQAGGVSVSTLVHTLAQGRRVRGTAYSAAAAAAVAASSTTAGAGGGSIDPSFADSGGVDPSAIGLRAAISAWMTTTPPV